MEIQSEQMAMNFITHCNNALMVNSEGAALKSGLPHDKMTESERICFPDYAYGSDAKKRVFLDIRNKILKMWLQNTTDVLTLDTATSKIKRAIDPLFVKRVHAYLQRYGYINFGWIIFERQPRPTSGKKVIVIGGGMAGDAAAKQLHLLGMDVTVLEARNYFGGRIHAVQREFYHTDMGAHIVSGAVGNPITILMEQMGLEHQEMPSNYALYDIEGQPIPKELVDSVKTKFMFVMNMTKLLSMKTGLQWESLSLYNGIEFIIEHLDQSWRGKQAGYDEDMRETLATHDAKKEELKVLYHSTLKAREQHLSRKPKSKRKNALKIYRQFQTRYSAATKEYAAARRLFREKLRNRPQLFFLTQAERRIMQWFIAHYEFTVGAPLENISLKHHRLRNKPDFLGPLTSIKRGHSSVMYCDRSTVKLQKNMVVTSIDYGSKTVKVHGINSWTQKPFSFSADVVLSTLPLGVLKKQQVLFHPPLPHWKTSAIQRMGLGSQVKILLRFQTIFWKPEERCFGKVGVSSSERGDAYCFYSNKNCPTLIAFSSGNAAKLFDRTDDREIIARFMEVLKSLFGANIPWPSEASVSHWTSSPYSQGAASYVAVGGEPEDYNALAFPLAHFDNGIEPNIPNLFFAGEHTTYRYAATTHGAYLSGLREAARIANCHLGPLDGTPTDVHYSLVDALNAVSRDETLEINMETLKNFLKEVIEEEDTDNAKDAKNMMVEEEDTDNAIKTTKKQKKKRQKKRKNNK